MLKLKTVLVTGASRGIGLAVAEALARAERGPLKLVLTARGGSDLEAARAKVVAMGGANLEVHAISMDVADKDSVRAGCGAAVRAVGLVQGLVLNAGVAVSAPLHETTDEMFARVFDVNVWGVFRPMRELLPGMLADGYGRVVVLGSIASKIGARYVSAYTASKHAALGLVRAAAQDYARAGITVNAVCPGYVDTPMTAGHLERIQDKTSLSRDKALQKIVGRTPQGRLFGADEVAHAVCFLLSHEAAGINGSTIDLDGGEMAG